MKPKANVGYGAEKRMARVVGVKPVPYSGSRWQAKEDGECSHFVMQHKSTNGKSLGVRAVDVDTLQRNARISHKQPLFVLEFVRDIIQTHNETPALQLLCIPFTSAGDIDAFCTMWLTHKRDCMHSDTERSKSYESL